MGRPANVIGDGTNHQPFYARKPRGANYNQIGMVIGGEFPCDDPLGIAEPDMDADVGHPGVLRLLLEVIHPPAGGVNRAISLVIRRTSITVTISELVDLGDR